MADGRHFIYNPTTFNVSPVSLTANFRQFAGSLSIVRNYAILITLLLGFGVFHKLSKSLTVVLVMYLSQSNLPNSIGLANNIFHINSPFSCLNVQLGWNLPRLQCEQLRFVTYGFNKSIIELSFMLYLAGISSAILIAYLRGYLETKQKAKRHFAWRNILAHSKQYLLQNVLSLHGLISFPAILQLKVIISKGTEGISKNVLNFIFSTYLLLVPCLLVAICLLKYRYRSFSVLFNSLRRTRFTVAVWLMTTLHPYVISILSIFVPSQLNLYLMIAFNGLLLVFWGMCLQLARIKVSYVLVLLKQMCVLYISISLLFNGQDGLVLRVGFFCSLAIGSIQLLQIVFRIVMLVLVNKQIIKSKSIHKEQPPVQQPQSVGHNAKLE